MITCKCLRCGYEWLPKRSAIPARCANEKCKSPDWDKFPRWRRGQNVKELGNGI